MTGGGGKDRKDKGGGGKAPPTPSYAQQLELIAELKKLATADPKSAEAVLKLVKKQQRHRVSMENREQWFPFIIVLAGLVVGGWVAGHGGWAAFAGGAIATTALGAPTATAILLEKYLPGRSSSDSRGDS